MREQHNECSRVDAGRAFRFVIWRPRSGATHRGPLGGLSVRMKATLQIVLAATLLLGCSRQDPVDRLMGKVEQQSVPSYLVKPIELPDTASPEQCISALTIRGALHLPKILQVRQAHTSIENFTAVLLDSNDGQKIVLLRPSHTNSWYFRIYDAK
jgi:hypothetical protein